MKNCNVSSTTIKLHAYNPICTVPISFMYMGKSQKKTENESDCSINRTVSFFF